MAILRSQTRVSARPDQDRIDREILLVEDQRSLALVAAKMLHERWGCRVLIATTLGQVRTIIEQKRHDFFLAVSDLNLPDSPNGEVIDVLIAAKIPVIAVTGAFDRGQLDNFMNKGVIDYVLKNSINAYEYIVELVGRLYKNSRTKVMVVDDTEEFRSLLRHMLQKQCLEVVVVNDGEAALERLEQQGDIKLVMVDYHMPKMDGFSFLANVRRKHGKDHLSVIGMSASGDKTLPAQFLKLGANDFLLKPFTYEELTCRVNHNLQMLESIEAIRYVANHDYLTGLLNRRAFFEQGGKLHADAKNKGKTQVVAMIDIDFFKKINDSYGHDGGDAVLRHFSALLNEHFGSDLVGRLGGEEFALIFAEGKQAIERCEAFRQHIEKSAAEFGESLIPLTISIGLCHQVQANLDAALRLADENLYKAKSSGRNRVVSS